MNNAGFGGVGAVEDVDDEEARVHLETMVVAPMRLARIALPGMRERGEGRIVNISSIYGRTTTPLTGWYQAAKHAIEALSDALRVEVASSGVRVILVEPGGFRTAIWDDLERDVDRRRDSRFGSAYRRSLVMQRLGEPFMGDPARVGRAVAGAVGSRLPRPRYLVGYDAQALAMVDRFTPTVLKDTVARFVLGL